ncbi:MAG TPA: response regulator transcription factor [Sulfurovum sp.]|nr:response regulator transcription factor [Sulfurovum sp.]
MKILLLEDELMLQESIEEYLNHKGYVVDVSMNGMEAYDKIINTSYDLLILDINTPVLNGLKLLEKLQNEKIFIPTVFISAITEIEQISKAYELGCYDYLKKPFHLKELTLHIDRLLKMAQISSKSIVKMSKMYTYDLEKRRLFFDNEEQVLTPKQGQIIHLFAANVNRIVDFDMLRHYVWEEDFVDNATIRAEIHRVKKILKENLIESIKGIGYKINPF